MTIELDFYFDYGSPTSYLADAQIQRIAADTGAVVNYRPVLLGGILKASGNASPMDVPLKRDWMVNDVTFFAKRYEIPFAFNPHFPVNTLNLMRGAIYAQDRGFLRDYSDAIFSGMWVEQRNLAELSTVKDVLDSRGFSSPDILEGMQDPEIKSKLIAVTDTAFKRGLFGAPVAFLGDTMFFGQDRIQYLEEAIRRISDA
jgi:2-hydroxychromene-2-carboxylate isomerase